MLSRDEEAQMRALKHLVTVLIRHLGESDETWCRDLLEAMREQQRNAALAGKPPDEAFGHVIAIIERALAT
jgi:hypothetical protein